MSQLDELLPLLITTDTRKKIDLGNDLLEILNSNDNIDCQDIGRLIDGIVPWIHSSNFKIVLNGLSIATVAIQKLGDDFRPYITSIIPPTIDRLGDNRDSVREKAQILLASLTDIVLLPNQLFEKLLPAFSHKNGKVREEVMLCLQNALEIHGAPSITISRLLPLIIKLLSDPTVFVRDCAFNTLVEAYKHYGDRMRNTIQKKFPVPPIKLPSLLHRFDEVRDTGQLLETAKSSMDGRCEDETDRASLKSVGSKSRASSAPPVRRSMLGAPSASKHAGGTAAGAMDESSFFASFEDVPKIAIYSAKDLEVTFNKIRECIQNPQNEWDKRVEALKKIRSVMVAGGPTYNEFFTHLRQLEPAMQVSIKDLRSQVVREACIGVAFMSQELNNKIDHFCEAVLPALVNLIPNTAKIMASAGIVTIRFVIQNTHYHRLIPILTREMNSKSREIRRSICELLDQLVHTWSSHCMERHVGVLAEAIKKGITDADSEARAYSRKAYWGFAEHFRDESDKLLHSLDPSYKKLLQGEMTTSISAHNIQATSNHRQETRPWSRGSSVAGSREDLRQGPSSLSSFRRPANRPPAHDSSSIPASFRSNSAIDLQAARRAQARAQYATAQRLKIGSGISLPRPRRLVEPMSMQNSIISEQNGRSRNRVVSRSQPGSRSGSPSSRLCYVTYTSPSYVANSNYASSTLGRPPKRSAIPRSRGTSREPSPNRLVGFGSTFTPKNRSRSISGTPEMPPQVPMRTPRQLMSSHKILQQSREAENALADALVSMPPDILRSPNRKLYSKSFDEQQSDESETSSICSDPSLDSFRRNDHQFSWYGSQNRMKDHWDSVKVADVNEIILKSASTHWADRKEGLMGLHSFLRSTNLLSRTELHHVTELFTKMFMDTHTKVFNLFLDTLMELITVHHADLNDWLYILLTRLLNKLGADLLGSVQTKIHRTLDLVRDFFPCDLQFQVLMRFLTDSTQTPNTKVKVAILTYLKCLVDVMAAADLASYTDTPLALSKILNWTVDQKSVEIRRAASAAFIALFNCNSRQLTILLQHLPMATQSSASQLIKNHLKRAASLDASPSSLPPRTPPSLGTTPPVLQSPNTSLPRVSRPTRLSTIDYDDTENLNPEELFRNLKRTTDEIRNYSFDHNGADRKDSLEKHRDSTSQFQHVFGLQDSGISQLSAGGYEHKTVDVVDGCVDEISELLSGVSSNVSSPTHRKCLDACIEDEDMVDLENESDIQLMSSIITELSNTCDEERQTEKRTALTSLIRLARTGSTLVWTEHFRVVLRLLLERLNSEQCSFRDAVLSVLTEMMRRCPLVQHFLKFSELIILRVLKANGDQVKAVARAAQICSGTVAEILPPDIVIRVLKPLIQMGEFPLNRAAITMLNKLVEAHPPAIVATALPEIMPGLLKAYDNEESVVRKASVFCMVALHNAVGEESMKPYLQTLPGSKLKLLQLYIKRSVSQTSGASSPKSEF